MVQNTHDPETRRLGEVMVKATNEERGTVAGLASWSADTDQEYAEGLFVTVYMHSKI